MEIPMNLAVLPLLMALTTTVLLMTVPLVVAAASWKQRKGA
jgi:hypothetical protein